MHHAFVALTLAASSLPDGQQFQGKTKALPGSCQTLKLYEKLFLTPRSSLRPGGSRQAVKPARSQGRLAHREGR